MLFKELASVSDSCSRQIGVRNERYTIYIIERLENGLRKIDWICDALSILSQPENELPPHNEEVVAEYLEKISSLSTILQLLVSYWDVYFNEINSRVVLSNN